MDTRKLTELLRATMDPGQQQQAEEQLNQIHKIIGFVPTLLRIVMQNDVDLPVRQAGVIYLKNLITQNWQDREAEPGAPMVYSIHEQDRAMIRDSIVEAVVHSPDIIRVQLAICVYHIIVSDFPGRWTQIVDKISIYLQNPDVNGWTGALICLYQLTKNYEYKTAKDRTPLTEAMNLLLPMMYHLMVNLMQDPSEQSVLLQKQILKIYHALTQYSLPLDLISRETFSQWMEVCRQIVDRPAPDSSHIDEDERPEMVWWKVKKWAMHIMVRMFERYGCPGHEVIKDYQKFAAWFLPTFTTGILEVLLKVLDQYRNKIYVSPRVLTDILNYLKQASEQVYSWKLIKPHMVVLIQDVIFPIMSYTDADQELWETDPYEYIRVKFDVFEDFGFPVPAAQAFLLTSCKKRKGILQKTMQIVMEVLTHPNSDSKQKDGALHIVGTLAEVLLKKKMFREQMETLLTNYVFPEFGSPHGLLRARACWVTHHFHEIKLKNPQVLAEIMRLTSQALLTDKELPVKVEAAVALQMYLTTQDHSHQYIEAQIKPITMEILAIIRETQNEDLTNVMQKIVCTYSDQLLPIAVEICQHLATTFSQVLESDDSSDSRAITAMGLLNTIETLLSVMEDHPQIMSNLHPIVIRVVGHIFQQNVIEFYEEACSLVYDLTAKVITPDMWQMLELIYQVFQKDGYDYFVDMMPALHNYVTVDTEAFLSNQNHLIAMFNMCKSILTGDPGEDPECHAAKLLEVIILQCKGRIDECIPIFVDLVLTRLTREVKSSELRTMCLQVVIAALYYNPTLLLSILDKMQSQLQQPGSESICSHFIKQWLHDTDCFLGIHDRKLCVLGLCTLMSMGEARPPVLNELVGRILPALILLFEGLKRAYQVRAQEAEEEESEDDDDDCEEALSSDEDDLDENNPNFLSNLANRIKEKGANHNYDFTDIIKDDDDDDSDGNADDELSNEIDETALESYTTPLDDDDDPQTVDEYITFHDVYQNLAKVDASWYEALNRALRPEQMQAISEILLLAQQKRHLKQSKQIEKSGGYAFTQQTIPTSFNFSGS
ncbi:importin-7 isoform X2 [Phlebotomus papatasi]|nr:importin-7 isoform X2 [Phlebotomus papatasi]